MIFTTGIKKLFYLDSYADYKNLQKDEGIEFLLRFNIKVEKFHSLQD